MPGRASAAQVRATLEQGLAALQSGRPAEAVVALRRAVKLAPKQPDALHLLAMALGQTGELVEAASLIRRALKRDPSRAVFHDTHGNILAARQALPEARQAYERALKLEPRLGGTRFNLARLLLQSGELSSARAALDTLLAQQPDHAAALATRGDVACRQGDMAAAQEDLAESLRLDPDSVPVRLLLGRVQQAMGQPEAALATLVGTAPAIVAERARVHQSQGRLADAQSGFEAALAERPSAADAAGLAEVLLWQGDTSRATDVLAPYADTDAPQVAVMRARLALASDTEDARLSASVDGLERWLTPPADAAMPVAMRRQLLFCLADLRHRQADYDAAFERYQQANTQGRVPFDSRAHRAFVAEMIAFYSAERVAQMATAQAGPVRPVFIVGMPRSGTSLVEQILARHPHVDAHGERPDIARMFAAHTKARGLRAALADSDTESLNQLAGAYFSARPVAPGASMWTDKMPQNVLYLGWIRQLFPDARFVILARVDEAVALSCYRQDFLDPTLGYADDLASLADVVHDTQCLVEHWQQVLPDSVVGIRYEELVVDFDAQVRRLLNALGLPFDERCLSFEDSERFVNTASHAQVRRGLYRDSLDLHEHYAGHLAPFTLALAARRAGEGDSP